MFLWKKVFSKRENTPFSILNPPTRTVVTNLQSFSFLIIAFLFWKEKDIKYSLIVSLFYRVSDTFAAEKELMGPRKWHWNIKTSTIGVGLTLFTVTRLMPRRLSSSRFWKEEKSPENFFIISRDFSALAWMSFSPRLILARTLFILYTRRRCYLSLYVYSS